MHLKLTSFYCVFVILIFLNTSVAYSQNSEFNTEASNNTKNQKSKTKIGKLLKLVWGDQLESSLTAMPIGLHTDFEKHSSKKRSTINGLHEALYFAGNYKSVELAVFQNSFGDPVVAAFYKRAWNFTNRLSMNFGGGIMYGYGGRLRNTEGIPFRDTWLIRGDINPVVGFELDYRFYKKWSVHTSIAPRIIIYGFRYIL